MYRPAAGAVAATLARQVGARSSHGPRPQVEERRGASPRWALLVALGALAACGWRGHGQIYYARDRGAQQPHEATYRVGLPGGGFEPVKVKHSQVAWIDRSLGATIRVHSECTGHGDARLDQFLDHLRIGWSSWQVLDTHPETLVGREALRAHVRARLDGILFEHEFWIVKKDGCLFDLSVSAPPGSFARALPAFHRVVKGFRFPLEND